MDEQVQPGDLVIKKLSEEHEDGWSAQWHCSTGMLERRSLDKLFECGTYCLKEPEKGFLEMRWQYDVYYDAVGDVRDIGFYFCFGKGPDQIIKKWEGEIFSEERRESGRFPIPDELVLSCLREWLDKYGKDI